MDCIQPLSLVYVTSFASINQENFTGSWSITTSDVSLFVSFIYIFILFIGLLGSHQNIGIGFTLVRYPIFLLSLPLMFYAA